MKKLLLPLILLFAYHVQAQKVIKTDKVTDHSIYIKGDNFEGIIFGENYYQNPKDTAETKIRRFTPSGEDIRNAELLLKHKANYTGNGVDIKYIFSHLGKYHRQYIGYLNEKGEKLIYVNCFPIDDDWANKKIKGINNDMLPGWYDKLFYVFDGGRSYWQATINLNSKSIINISVNGVA